MKKIISVLIASAILVTCVSLIASAAGIVLPEYNFGGNQTPTYPAGDINCDGSINNTDYALLIRISLGIAIEESGNADVNGDGSFTSLDISALEQLLRGA